ncbi:hypothetical protein Tco_1409395 [Tanacetum coccineum]
MRPAASAPCVCELDASSGVRRPNELKRNVVEQDDRQVNVPFKRTCVRSLDLFLSLDQQPYIVLRVYPVDPSLRDSNGVSPVGPSAGRLKRNISSQDDSQNGFDVASTVPSKRLCAAIKCRFRTSYTQFLPQPVNSVNVNLSSTPIDDHSDHDHNDVHVADECIPPPDRDNTFPDDSEKASDEEIEGPMKDQPLSIDASPTALLLGYIADSDPKEDKEDPEEDPADHPADK